MNTKQGQTVKTVGLVMSLPSTCKPTPLQTVIILNILRTAGGSGYNSKTIYGIHIKDEKFYNLVAEVV